MPLAPECSAPQRQHVPSLLSVGVVRLFDTGTVRRAAQRLRALPGARAPGAISGPFTSGAVSGVPCAVGAARTYDLPPQGITSGPTPFPKGYVPHRGHQEVPRSRSIALWTVRLPQMRVRFPPLSRPRPADVRALWQAQTLPTPILDVRPVPFAQGFRLGRHPRSPPMVSAVRGCRRVAEPLSTRIVRRPSFPIAIHSASATGGFLLFLAFFMVPYSARMSPQRDR